MGIVTEGNLFIAVCPAGEEVHEYPGPAGRPSRKVCSKCGQQYVAKCPSEACEDPWYHPSDFRGNFHGCGSAIPWAVGRDRVVELTPVYSPPLGRSLSVVPDLSDVERQDLIIPPSERLPQVGPPTARAVPWSSSVPKPEEVRDQEQRRFLQVTFDAFVRDNSWPELDDLQRELDLREEDLEVERVGVTVPEAYARIVWERDGRLVKLRVRGIARCDGAADELDRFMKAVRLFVQKQVARERVTRTELGSAIGAPDEHAIRRTYLLLEGEARFLGGGIGGVDDDWERDAYRAAREFRKVATLAEYLAKVDEIEGRPGPVAQALQRLVDAQVKVMDRGKSVTPRPGTLRAAPTSENTSFDVFIAHAHEDKDSVAAPLAAKLREHGLRVWYDDYELRLGDSLRRRIDHGLIASRFGVVILSPAFFEKEWAKKELDGLIQKESDGAQVVLPVWHGVRRNDVAERSLLLADRFAVRTSEGVEAVASAIIEVLSQS